MTQHCLRIPTEFLLRLPALVSWISCFSLYGPARLHGCGEGTSAVQAAVLSFCGGVRHSNDPWGRTLLKSPPCVKAESQKWKNSDSSLPLY